MHVFQQLDSTLTTTFLILNKLEKEPCLKYLALGAYNKLSSVPAYAIVPVTFPALFHTSEVFTFKSNILPVSVTVKFWKEKEFRSKGLQL